MQPVRKPITSHLQKSIISNVIQTARACLNEPSRPFTPAEAQRALFSQNEYANRPPSSYAPRPVLKKTRNQSVETRKEPVIITETVKTRDLDALESAMLKKSEPIRPIKPINPPEMQEFSDFQGLISLLQGLIDHEEARLLYTYLLSRDEDWEELAGQVGIAGRKGAMSDKEALCEVVLGLVEDLADVKPQVLLLREVFVILLQLHLIVRTKHGKVKGLGLLQQACSLLYQPSREKSNDELYSKVRSM